MANKPKEVIKDTPKKAEEKKAQKEPDVVEVVFDPVFDTATEIKMFDLTKTKKTRIDGEVINEKTPLIEGLPRNLVVQKGKPFEITKVQYEALKEINLIETNKEREERRKKAKEFNSKSRKRQYGVDPELAKLFEFRSLFNDVLVKVE